MNPTPANYPQILVIGSMNMDLVLRSQHFPKPGESIQGGDLHQIPGGKGANQAVAAARLGAKVTMMGAVGDDAMGRELIRNLRRDRINTRWIDTIEDAPTGVAVILLNAKGENQIVTSPGANGCVTPGHIEKSKKVMNKAHLIILQNEIPLPAIRAAVQQARKLDIPVIYNLAPASRVPRTLLRQLTAVIVNETEAETVLGFSVRSERSARRAVRELAMTVRGEIAVLTLGARGALIAQGSEVRFQPAFTARVVDTTAAGDAFVGAFGVQFLKLGDPFEACRWACAAGGVAVTRLGAQISLPSRQELNKLLTSRRKR